MKMNKIISYIHLLGCVGWLIAILIVLLPGLMRGDFTISGMTMAFLLLFSILITTLNGIILVGYKKQLENIKGSSVEKTRLYIHLLMCIGWSIFGAFAFWEEVRDGYIWDTLIISTFFLTAASGIYLAWVNIGFRMAWLWKLKKLPVLWTSILIIVAMCLFPPWVRRGEIASHAHFLFSSGVGNYKSCIYHAHVDLVRLVIQCVMVVLITGALFYTLNIKKAEGCK